MVAPAASVGVGIACLVVTNIISSSAGIGGGALNIAILLFIFGFSFNESVVYSLCNVCGNYISQIIVNRNKRHPLSRSRSVIDWLAVLVFVPAQLSGNLLGVIVSSSIPSTVLEICTILVLAVAFVMTVRNCYKLWLHDIALNEFLRSLRSTPLLPFRRNINEQQLSVESAISAPAADPIPSGTQSDNLRLDAYLTKSAQPAPNSGWRWSQNSGSDDSSRPGASNPANGIGSSVSVDQARPRSQPNPSTTGLFDHHRISDFSVSEEESFNNHVVHDYKIFAVLAMLWVAYAAIYVVMQLLIPSCGKSHYFLLGLLFLPMLIALPWSLRYVIRKQMLDATIILKGDIDFSKFSLGPTGLVFVIGVLGALLGLGGGELTGPLMLYLGLLPLVASSTTSAISLMSVSSDVLHFMLRKQIDWRWVAVFFSIGIFAGYCGRQLLLYLIYRYKRTSITTLFLAIILFFSTWLMVYKVAFSERSLKFLPFCVD